MSQLNSWNSAVAMILEGKTILSGGARSFPWEVILIAAALLLLVVVALFLLLRRAKRLAATDEGEGWGYDRYSLMREESSATVDRLAIEEIGEKQSAAPAPVEAAARGAEDAGIASSSSSLPEGISPQAVDRDVASPESPIESRPEAFEAEVDSSRADSAGDAARAGPGFRFQSAIESEEGERRSRYRRLAVAAAVLLMAGTLALSADLRGYLRRGWDAMVSRVSATSPGKPAAGAGLIPLPQLDVIQSAFVYNDSVSLQVRVRNISSESFSSLQVEIALLKRGVNVPETRLASVQPVELGPNQEGTAELRFQGTEFASYQVNRILKSSGEQITFRLTNQLPSPAPSPRRK